MFYNVNDFKDNVYHHGKLQKLKTKLKNIYITNLKDQYAYTYDGSKFSTVLKSDILEELVDNHIENIEYSVEEYKEKIKSKNNRSIR